MLKKFVFKKISTIKIPKNVGRFANVQFANVLRRFAKVFSRFANVAKLLKCIELTIYQICLNIFSLVVDKRTKNNLYVH